MVWLGALLGCLLVARPSAADTGVLLPTNLRNWKKSRGPALVLRSMKSDVTIDGLLVRTRLVQVFQNRTGMDLEGRYVYRIPPGGGLSDFAIWEDGVRIPGVVVERRRAREIYEELTARKIDPGLLEMDDPSGAERSAFAARVYPIPAHGTKRIELEYRQELSLVGRKARYHLPLAPTHYGTQVARRLELDLRFRPPYPLESQSLETSAYGPLQGEGTHWSLDFEGDRVSLEEDLALRFEVRPEGEPWRLLAHRDPRSHHRFEPFSGGRAQDPRGTLLLRYLIPPDNSGRTLPRPRRFLFLVDLSLSMHWQKLEKLVTALRTFVGALEPEDRFTVATFTQGPPRVLVRDRRGTVPEGEATWSLLAEQALEGATDLAAAAAFAGEWLRTGEDPSLAVLATDGYPTWGETGAEAVLDALGDPGAGRRLAVLGVGSGARDALLADLATRGRGLYRKLDEVGDPSFVLQSFWEQAFQQSVEQVRFELPEGSPVEDLYLDDRTTPTAGSTLRFVARYREPGDPVAGTLRYRHGGRDVAVPVELPRPGHDLEHPQLPRVWAEARVRHLLVRIDREGERAEWVDEIVRLAKKYKLATPYTSFLAAPRALLRPRSIKPGDPVLRVEVGPEVRQVVARLPWGELLTLRRLPDEGVFETRFLAPPWVEEGRHQVRLVLTDGNGERTLLREHFRLDGTPPTVRVRGELPAVRPGDRLALAVYADADTRTLTARLAGGAPVSLRYSDDGAVSKGLLPIPDLPPGKHRLVLEAEDFAHNRSSKILYLEVQG